METLGYKRCYFSHANACTNSEYRNISGIEWAWCGGIEWAWCCRTNGVLFRTPTNVSFACPYTDENVYELGDGIDAR